MKHLYYIFLAVLLGWMGCLLYAFCVNDASMVPLSQARTPDAFDPHYVARPPLVLVSYADGPEVFFKNQNALVASAVGKGFDAIYSYKRSHIDPEFYATHKGTLTQKRGAGYWLWKPYFILETLKKLPENAILVYGDSGVIFTSSLDHLFEHLKDNDMITIGYGNPIPLRMHLKKEAYSFFPEPVTEEILNKQEIWDFFLVMRNTPEIRALITKWLDVAKNQDAITDAPLDPANQDPLFDGHLHDESLLSVIVAQNPTGIITIPRNVLRHDYGIHNFHRQVPEFYKSSLFIMAGFHKTVSDIFWNNFMIKWLRSCFIKPITLIPKNA